MTLHQELVKKALPFIDSYQDDLLVHDKNQIKSFPDRPFLHFTGSTGTNLVTFHFLEDYPAKDELVPYLFGKAGRFHILSQVMAQVECMERCNRMSLILYYDGNRLNEITYQKAKSLAREYSRKMRRNFN